MDEFLKELAELTRKHKLYITGCGCCGSPRIEELGDNALNGSYYVKDDMFELDWKTPEEIKENS